MPSCDGGIALEQIFHGDGTRTVVTHAASVLTEISVLAGALSFPLACAEIAAPARFALLVPPRSVLPIRCAGARATRTIRGIPTELVPDPGRGYVACALNFDHVGTRPACAPELL